MEKKEYLMDVIRRINRAKSATIQILREQPMCNIKIIERSSKSTKDPNPVATTLSTMTQKYPLSIDKEKAIRYGVPIHFLARRGHQYTADTHTHGRILCKKEAIDWWVDQSPLPEESTQAVINLLFYACREDVKKYYSIKWKGSIRFGPVNMERRTISTRDPMIKADRKTREKLIEVMFFPEFSVQYDPIPREMLEKMKEIVMEKTCSRMTLPSQIRILLNQMDPRHRVLPVPSGFNDSFATFKHAIVGNNYTIAYSVGQLDIGSENKEKLIIKTVQCVVYEAKMRKLTEEDVKSALFHTWIDGITLEQLVRTTPLKETPEIKVARSCLKIPVITESTSDGLTTSPGVAAVHTLYRQNVVGTKYKVYLGEEQVSFKYGEMRGQFTHNGPALTDVTCNYTTMRELTETICEIAVYIRWGFGPTTARNYHGIKMQVRRYTRDHLEILLDTTLKDIRDIVYKYPLTGRAGKLRLLDSSEYQAYNKTILSIDRHLNLYNPSTKQELNIQVPDNQSTILPENVKSTSRIMYPHLSLKEIIKLLMWQYNKNSAELCDRVLEGDFKWMNEHINKFLGNNAPQFSHTARILTMSTVREVRNSPLIAFFYCFCNSDPSEGAPIMSVTTTTNQLINLMGMDGIFKFDPVENKYYLYNVEIGEVQPSGMGFSSTGILAGFRILPVRVPTAPLLSLPIIELNPHKFQDGEIINTFFESTNITIQRDSSITLEVYDTINRQISKYYKEREKKPSIISLKRKALESLEDQPMFNLTAKRPREEDSDEEDDSNLAPAGGFGLDDDEFDMDDF